MSRDLDDHADTGGPAEPPRGVTKRRRGGWQGEEMEMTHQRDAFREDKSKAHAAVDISQFQNHEVGKGYQAKHVVRQRSGKESSSGKMQDMTGEASGKKTKELPAVSTISVEERDSFIRSSPLREFRREIEKILSS
jgi:hypothetical protein